MRGTLSRWWKVWTRQIVFGASEDVGRVFLVCFSCRRVVPYYRVVISRPRSGQLIGCKCGQQRVAPARVSQLAAGWWVYGDFVWRRLILRRKDWDPRAPQRRTLAGGAA